MAQRLVRGKKSGMGSNHYIVWTIVPDLLGRIKTPGPMAPANILDCPVIPANALKGTRA